MSRRYYSEIHLHITWHTKDNSPLLIPKVEAAAHHALRGKCVRTSGVFVHAVGGIEDHVHVAVTIVPTVGISEFIGELKGASSHEVNQKLGDGRKVLQWQEGYGVVSFGTRNLPWVLKYIQEQKERHARNQLEARLERVEPKGDDEPQGEHREAR